MDATTRDTAAAGVTDTGRLPCPKRAMTLRNCHLPTYWASYRSCMALFLLGSILGVRNAAATLEPSVSIALDGAIVASTHTILESEEKRYSISNTTGQDDDGVTATLTESTSIHEQCGIWLAPSTIPGAGLGLYAGRDFRAEEPLQETGDLTMNIVDLRLHTKHLKPYPSFLWDEYTWNAEALRMPQEGFGDLTAASMGFGATANCFLPILNIEEWNPTYTNPQQLHRSRDPGAGAMSLYGNRTTTAIRDIMPGEELFVTYGENWFLTRPKLGPIPLTDDLNRAHGLVQQYRDLYMRHSYKLSLDVLDGVWDTFVRNSSFVDSRVIGAFHHQDDKELFQLLQQNKTLAQLRIEQSRRSLDWLHEHGTCGDHLTAKPSTLDQAGMGAFATRFLPRGTRVAAMPLIHIPDRNILNIYHFDPVSVQKGEPLPKPELGVRTYQLMLNYCFGHNESTLLLCPYGPMTSYINHNQTLANVKIIWADASRGNHQPELLEKEISEWGSDARAKLGLEIVALRDIEAGEEVIIDYGSDWERAWQQHLLQWQPEPGADVYRSAHELNMDKDLRVHTEFEKLKDPSLHRPGVDLWCNNLFKDGTWRDQKLNGALDEFIRLGNGRIYRCDVLRVRQDEEDDMWLYSVVMWYEDQANGRPPEYIDYMDDVPSEAFLWYDTPYSTDTFLNNAFRHAMGIPDDMFPLQWRNLREA